MVIQTPISGTTAFRRCFSCEKDNSVHGPGISHSCCFLGCGHEPALGLHKNQEDAHSVDTVHRLISFPAGFKLL